MPKTKRCRLAGRRRKAAAVQQRVEASETADDASSSGQCCLTGDKDRETPASSSAIDSPSSRVSGVDSEAMQLAHEFRTLCAAHANPSNAAAMSQYMRNQFSFFGIKTPERRQLQKQFTKTHRDRLTRHSFLLQFTPCLWRLDERECQLYGVDLMSKFRKEALGETLGEYEEVVACVEVLITTKSWWDTVDMLASHTVGYIVRERREQGVRLMEQWIAHPCMWLRRTALLHQLSYKTDTDRTRLFKFCLAVADEDEFFIRKAIGWSLREYSRTDKTAVREFVEKNREKLSNLSAREALKHC